jgi:tRNA(fMet)-specific endonuclease VapC
LPLDKAAALAYGVIRADLARRGQLIGPNDVLIAAIALVAKMTVVTYNTREFSRVGGLVVEDWHV